MKNYDIRNICKALCYRTYGFNMPCVCPAGSLTYLPWTAPPRMIQRSADWLEVSAGLQCPFFFAEWSTTNKKWKNAVTSKNRWRLKACEAVWWCLNLFEWIGIIRTSNGLVDLALEFRNFSFIVLSNASWSLQLLKYFSLSCCCFSLWLPSDPIFYPPASFQVLFWSSDAINLFKSCLFCGATLFINWL